MRRIPDGDSKCLKVIEKFENILQKNSGFSTLCTIQRILKGKEDYQNLDPRFDQDDVKFFMYAPITSCDVERSFSQYKNILSERRRSFTFNNLKQYLVVCYFHKQKKSATRNK